MEVLERDKLGVVLEDFSTFLNLKRNEKDLSMRQISKLIGSHYLTVQGWFNGKRLPTNTSFLELNRVLDVPESEWVRLFPVLFEVKEEHENIAIRSSHIIELSNKIYAIIDQVPDGNGLQHRIIKTANIDAKKYHSVTKALKTDYRLHEKYNASAPKKIENTRLVDEMLSYYDREQGGVPNIICPLLPNGMTDKVWSIVYHGKELELSDYTAYPDHRRAIYKLNEALKNDSRFRQFFVKGKRNRPVIAFEYLPNNRTTELLDEVKELEEQFRG